MVYEMPNPISTNPYEKVECYTEISNSITSDIRDLTTQSLFFRPKTA
jgi:hypothetical protein